MNYLPPPDESRNRPGLGRWARLRMRVPTPLRRGAWYPVLSAGREEVVLDVHGVSTILASDLVEIVHERPQTWSVVPPELGGPYLVCPECADRVRNFAANDRSRCSRCGGWFAISLDGSIAATG